jgi:hypothetical protein
MSEAATMIVLLNPSFQLDKTCHMIPENIKAWKLAEKLGENHLALLNEVIDIIIQHDCVSGESNELLEIFEDVEINELGYIGAEVVEMIINILRPLKCNVLDINYGVGPDCIYNIQKKIINFSPDEIM